MIQDPRIEDYLDHVCASLIDTVPYARRAELRTELHGHLEALVTTHEELGSSRDVAVLMALRQFGPPRDLAREWAREWTHDQRRARLQPAWRAMSIALASFGVATLLAVGLLAGVLPRGGMYLSSSPELVMLGVIATLLPAIAGVATGLLAPARHALGAFFALAALALPSAGLALHAVVHATETPASAVGFALGIVQPLFWIPIGCASAAAGGALRDYLSRQPHRWVLQ